MAIRFNPVIFLDEAGEFKVPAPDGSEDSAYFTDDPKDAKDTCDDLWKGEPSYAGSKITLVSEHPEFISGVWHGFMTEDGNGEIEEAR